VFITSSAAWSAKAYWGPYAISKAAVDVMARTWAAETATTALHVNLFNPGPIRTRMRAAAMPGEDPMTLPTPEQAAEKIVALCLPSFSKTGKLYSFPSERFLSFREPS
jgi:NAD(P)-dependent dehydrogenase (short-subunit alcohol dehydrogenase family)